MTDYFKIPKEESVDLIVKTCLDEGVTNPKQIAYILASAQHESGNFQYSSEINGRSQAKALGYSGGENYFGRGYVQITHKEKYAEFDRLLGLNGALIKNPDLAERPDIAAKILVIGMRDGHFRFHDKAHKNGHDINEYITDTKTDYYNARNIVNGGHDKANEIKAYAESWENKLPALIQKAQSQEPKTTPEYNSSPDKYTPPQSSNTTIDTHSPLSKTHQSLITDSEKHVHNLYKEYGLTVDKGTHNTVMCVAVAAAEQGMCRIDRSAVKDGNINVAQMDNGVATVASVNGNVAANTPAEQSLSKLASIEQSQTQAMNNPSQALNQPQQGRSIG